MRGESGFTLLEILAALAVASVGIAALASTTNSAVTVLQSTENRTIATWVAGNRLAELRMSRNWPAASTRDSSNELGGRNWFYREVITETADAELLRVDLSVYSDKEQSKLEAELFGYLSRYSPPEQTAPEDDSIVNDGQGDAGVNPQEATASGNQDQIGQEPELQQ